MRLYAILSQMDYDGIFAPSYISTNLEQLKKVNKNKEIIGYIDLEPGKLFKTEINTETEESFESSIWNIYEGKTETYTWRNIITGEQDPNYESDPKYENSDPDDWEDLFIYREYKDGKLIKEWFN